MAFRQYTRCVEIEYFDPRDPLLQAALTALYITLVPGGFTALLAIAGAASPWCLVFLADIYVAAWLLVFCEWWLYRRLVCIPAPADHPADPAGDHLAIGLLINIEPPGSGSFIDNIDNDYSIGILPCPLPPGADRNQVVQNSPFGYLVEEQPVTSDHGLPYAGEHAVCPGHPESERSEVLHCEFEGRGMYDMLLASRVALFLAVAALFACLLPGIGWIIAAILALLSLLGLAVGWGVGQFDAGDPTDVNPNVGQLSQCADTLMIKGHWVYDSLHTGAYELHPVTFCCKANCDSGDLMLLRDRWLVAIHDATTPATVASQEQPQNQWQVHPLIDGCQPPIIE